MKTPNFSQPFIGRFLLIFTLMIGLFAAGIAHASDASAQHQFASPGDAVKALMAAVQSGDKSALHDIFGPNIDSLLTGDPVQDQANFKAFSQAMTDACVPTPDGDGRYLLTIGTNSSSFPIPLVKNNGQWVFDTAAGEDEIINRHIGWDELRAIGVCRAYVNAQKQYFSQARDGSGVQKYAPKFKSSSGEENGLYWDPTNGPSPFEALVDQAREQGYSHDSAGNSHSHPFHGYYFRVLTGQGSAAPGGKKDYLDHGNLTGGFALVAYPADWGKSGIMTFIVNQDGSVYQRNFGPKTSKVATSLTLYNPDRHWNLVSEPGIAEPE